MVEVEKTESNHMITRSGKRALEDAINSEIKRVKIDDSSSDDSLSDSHSESSDSHSESSDKNHRWMSQLLDPDEYDEDYDSDTDEKTISINYTGLVKLLSRQDPKASENLEKVMQTINDKTPNFMLLLSENLRHEHRVELVELYEALKEIEDHSKLEYLMLRDRINNLTKRYKRKKELQDSMEECERSKMEETREKLKETNASSDDTMETRILALNTSQYNKSVIFDKFVQMERLSSQDEEKPKLQSWLQWATKIPHDNIHLCREEIRRNILESLSKSMDEELHGMRKVKEQVLTFVNARLSNPTGSDSVLALVGVPGTGKTTIARLLADALSLPFSQLAFGGVRSADFLKGFEACYLGSHPGEIVRCLSDMKTKNGIIFLDEFEKAAANKDVAAALLHILDPQQNCDFRDNYLRQIKIDLSCIWFICSMNSIPEDSALKDRLHCVQVPGYSSDDKVSIIINYLLPCALKDMGREVDNVTISNESSKYLVSKVSPGNSGVRPVKSAVKEIIRKICFLVDIHSSDFDFKISFNIKSGNPDKYPVQITKEMIDIFCQGSKKIIPSGMYL